MSEVLYTFLIRRSRSEILQLYIPLHGEYILSFLEDKCCFRLWLKVNMRWFIETDTAVMKCVTNWNEQKPNFFCKNWSKMRKRETVCEGYICQCQQKQYFISFLLLSLKFETFCYEELVKVIFNQLINARL